MIQIQLKYKSFDQYYINLATDFIKYSLEFFKKSYKEILLPSQIKKITVIRSPHIDKNSREQFQIKTYKKFLTVNFENNQEVLIFLNILKNSQFIGIELEISVVFLDYFIITDQTL